MSGVVNSASQSLRAFSARIGTALAEAARVLRERIVALYRRIMAFMLSLWALAIKALKSAEELLTAVYLVAWFPSIGVGLIFIGWRTGISWITTAGALFLATLGFLLVVFRDSKPLDDSDLAKLWCRWAARLTLVGAMAVGMFVSFHAISAGSWIEGTVETVSDRIEAMTARQAASPKAAEETAEFGFRPKPSLSTQLGVHGTPTAPIDPPVSGKILGVTEVQPLGETRIQLTDNRKVLDPAVQVSLDLTADQRARIIDLKSKLREADQSLMEKMNNQEISRQDFQGAKRKNNKVLEVEIVKVLTERQTAKLKEMLSNGSRRTVAPAAGISGGGSVSPAPMKPKASEKNAPLRPIGGDDSLRGGGQRNDDEDV